MSGVALKKEDHVPQSMGSQKELERAWKGTFLLEPQEEGPEDLLRISVSKQQKYGIINIYNF